MYQIQIEPVKEIYSQLKLKSNYKCTFSFVIQAKNFGIGWVDTKYGANDHVQCQIEARKFINTEKHWCSPNLKRELRIVKNRNY